MGFQQKQKFDGITKNPTDGQYNTVRAIPELTMLMKDQDNVSGKQLWYEQNEMCRKVVHEKKMDSKRVGFFNQKLSQQ